MTSGNDELNYQFLLLIPPSQPSPKGEGEAGKAFPPWGKRERGSIKVLGNLLINNILKLTS